MEHDADISVEPTVNASPIAQMQPKATEIINLIDTIDSAGKLIYFPSN